jgi:hypothetical protein
MNDKFGAGYKIEKFGLYLIKTRLISEKRRGYAMHLHRTRVNIPIRIKIAMVVAFRLLSIDDFDAADLNYPVTLCRV